MLFWMVERRLNQRPAGEAGELRLIKQLDLYRDDAEKDFVLKGLLEINRPTKKPTKLSRVLRRLPEDI